MTAIHSLPPAPTARTARDHQKLTLLVRELLLTLGEDPSRAGLVETPERVATAYGKLLEGYTRELAQEITVFENTHGYDDLVVSGGIEFYSTCEHHLLPFWGEAAVGYIPDRHIIGLSKLARAVDIYARRLQDQERITMQIADELMRLLQPKGVAVLLRGRHLCNVARGVEKKDSYMTTFQYRGAFRGDSQLQQRFLAAVQLA